MTLSWPSTEDSQLGPADWSAPLDRLGGPQSAGLELFHVPYEVAFRSVGQPFYRSITRPLAYARVSVEPALEFPGFESAVRQARKIPDLGEDWDGEGSSGFLPATVQRAVAGTERLLETALLRTGRVPPTPGINPAHEGSIDIFWQLGDRDLLINVPPQADAPCSFFGEDQDGNTISGETPNLAKRLDLLTWLLGDV